MYPHRRLLNLHNSDPDTNVLTHLQSHESVGERSQSGPESLGWTASVLSSNQEGSVAEVNYAAKACIVQTSPASSSTADVTHISAAPADHDQDSRALPIIVLVIDTATPVDTVNI